MTLALMLSLASVVVVAHSAMAGDHMDDGAVMCVAVLQVAALAAAAVAAGVPAAVLRVRWSMLPLLGPKFAEIEQMHTWRKQWCGGGSSTDSSGGSMMGGTSMNSNQPAESSRERTRLRAAALAAKDLQPVWETPEAGPSLGRRMHSASPLRQGAIMATLITLAQYRMYDDHMDGGWGWAMAALMVVALVAIVALVIWFVRSSSAAHAHPQPGLGPETPMQILDRRLAQGEITPEEYKERAAILGKP